MYIFLYIYIYVYTQNTRARPRRWPYRGTSLITNTLHGYLAHKKHLTGGRGRGRRDVPEAHLDRQTSHYTCMNINIYI